MSLPTTNIDILNDVDSFLASVEELDSVSMKYYGYSFKDSNIIVDMIGVFNDQIIIVWLNGKFDSYVLRLTLEAKFTDRLFKLYKPLTEIKALLKEQVYEISKLEALTKYNGTTTYKELSKVYDWLQENKIEVVKRNSGAIILQKSS